MPFSLYPYEKNLGAYSLPMGTPDGRGVAFTASAAYQYISKHTRGFIAGLQYRTRLRLGVDLDFIRYREETDPNDAHLNYISTFFSLVPSEGPHHLLYFGFGGVWLVGESSRGGPAFSMGTMIFPKKPFSVKLKATIAAVRSKPLWDLSAEIGGHLRQAEVFTGYRSLIGPVEDLSGPFAGVRIWF